MHAFDSTDRRMMAFYTLLTAYNMGIKC